MKQNSMTRLMAVVLVLLSLSALVSGGYGLHSAAKDLSRQREAWEQIQERTDSYRSVLALLMDGRDYETMNADLEQAQREYDAASLQHRKDLAVFTATRSTLETADKTLAQSELALQNGITQLEKASLMLELQQEVLLSQMLPGGMSLQDIETLLAQMQLELSGVDAMLLRMVQLLEGMEELGEAVRYEVPDAEQEGEAEGGEEAPSDPVISKEEKLAEIQDAAAAAYEDLAAVYEESFQLLETTDSVVTGIADVEIPLALLETALSSVSSSELNALLDALAELDLDLDEDQLRETLASLTGDSIVPVTSGQAAEFHDTIVSTEETMDSTVGALLDRLGALLDTPVEEELTDAQLDTIFQAYLENIGEVNRTVRTLRTLMSPVGNMVRVLELAVGSALNQLNTINDALNQLDEAGAQMSAAVNQLIYGQLTLLQSRDQLEEEKSKLDDQAETLEIEKTRLDRQSDALESLRTDTENRKDWEEQERSLRSALMSNAEIKELSEDLGEVLPAAETWLDTQDQSIRHEYGARMGICLLLIASAVFAAASVAIAFAPKWNRGLFLCAALLCAVCSGSAIAVSLHLRRGLLYSGLVTGIAALTACAVSFPEGKSSAGG